MNRIAMNMFAPVISAFVLLVSMNVDAAAGSGPWSVRFIEPSSKRLFKPVVTDHGVLITSFRAQGRSRKDHPEFVLLQYRLKDPVSAISFDYARTGQASSMPITLLDAAGRELWRHDGRGEAPKTVQLEGLKIRGRLVFRVSRKPNAKLERGWSHAISNLVLTRDASEPRRDADGFILLDSLDELRGFAGASRKNIRMKPGRYRLNTAFFRHFIELTGSDNHWDLTGVTISASLDLFRRFGGEGGDAGFYCIIDVTGDRNVLEGLTIRNHGEGYGVTGRNKHISISGSDCLLRNVTVITSGSNPWGYGSFFGIGGGIVRKMNGIRIGGPARNTRLIGCRVRMRAMGHAIFVQGAVNTLIEDCHVDGLLRPTNEILAETSGIAFERGFKVPGYGEGVQIGPDRLIPPDEIMSLSEDGIRMYPNGNGTDTGTTIIRNCTVTDMRRGICTGLSEAPDRVINCKVTNCIAAGYNIGSNDTLTGCRSDAKYAEALCVPYLDSRGARVELDILDSRKRMANNLVSKINGRDHRILLRTSDPAFVPGEMTVELASKNGYGSFQRGRRRANGVTLENRTPARVILSPGAVGNRVISQGPVVDSGDKNEIKSAGPPAGAKAGVEAKGTEAQGRPAKPNVLLLLIDDLGWQDVGCYDLDEPTPYETPNIDRLAEKGVMFWHAYSPAPTCSPTRCAIMSGNHPARAQKTHVVGGAPPCPRNRHCRMMDPWYSGRMPADEFTLARALKQNGYVTGHVGKWHIAINHHAFPQPKDVGFDWTRSNRGARSRMKNRLAGFATDSADDPYRLDDKGYPFHQNSADALAFLREHKDKPFFLYYATWLVHSPIHTRSRALLDKYVKKMGTDPRKTPKRETPGQLNPFYGAMVQELDHYVGTVFDYLDRTEDPRWPGHKLSENTYLIFTSDNGGMEGGPDERYTDNNPLDRGKISAKEGGTRVPLIIRGPGIAKGIQTDVMANGLDFYPTILSLTGSARPVGKRFDGCDLSTLLLKDPKDPALVKAADGKVRDTMMWHFPHGVALESTIRMGDYKLIRNYDHVNNPGSPELELFRLYRTENDAQARVDIEEAKNLAKAMPEKTAAMNLRLTEMLTEMKASTPYYNPDCRLPMPHKEKVCSVLSHIQDDGVVTLRYQENGARVLRADLIYTRNGGAKYEEWFRAPVTLLPDRKLTVHLPGGTTHYYLNLIDENQFLVSYPEVKRTAGAKGSYTAGAIKARKTTSVKRRKPNVILILTDDQGYGDLSCHGNPVLRTPNMDRLREVSIRFTDFHASPLCTPTRAALMTGRYPANTGAFRTSAGRTLLHRDERTMANVFADNGYATGLMGKWHLGDNAPHRPQDRGFQDAVWHRCGGVGQVSDHWGNDYYDDMYERNGKLEKFGGYCTDVWFAESLRFIRENRDRPFFLYLSLNAPHSPYIVDEKWSKPYQDGDHGANVNFLGMIANIDHNLGLFREQLDSLGLSDNTILVFMTDNGTAAGAKFTGFDSQAVKGFNAGMRGKKCSIYEGGHRVPFFIHWPAGKMNKGRDITTLAAHIDVLPTLAELCGIKLGGTHRLDGISFAPLLKNPGAPAHRDHMVVQLHGGPAATDYLKAWNHSCVIKDRWRLINGKELYDLSKDPSQKNDIAADNPDVVEQLRALYPAFHEPLLPRMKAVYIDIGHPTEKPVSLCSQDWYLPEGNPPWNFRMIKKLSPLNGPWMVNVRKAGRYRITLRQWPAEAGKVVDAVRARVRVAGIEKESPVKPGSKGVVFEMDLPAGKTELRTWLTRKNGKVGGAYFTEVEALQDHQASIPAGRQAAQARVFNVKSYGATGDGVAMETGAVQKTIDACHAAGGGIVRVPAGDFQIGTIWLRSNITLSLDQGASLLGSTDIADYKTEGLSNPREGGPHCLIYAENASNIVIKGLGVIDGRGTPEHFPRIRSRGRETSKRPRLIRMVNCDQLTFSGVTYKRPAFWGLHLIDSRNIHINAITIRFRNNGYNNDGLDLDGCVDVLIENCDIDSGDDAICLKSSKNPCRRIVVRNCKVSSNTAPLKFGTSSRGGFIDVKVSDCYFYKSPMGAIKLQLVDGGRLEDVDISRIVMKDVGNPIFIRLGNRGRTYTKRAGGNQARNVKPEGAPIGTLKNVRIRDITAEVTGDDRSRSGPIMITGIPGHCVQDVVLENVTISYPGGGTREDAGRKVSEDAARYPEQFFFGVLPAWGAYIRHARNVTFNNVILKTRSPDQRQKIVLDDVEGFSEAVAD